MTLQCQLCPQECVLENYQMLSADIVTQHHYSQQMNILIMASMLQ